MPRTRHGRRLFDGLKVIIPAGTARTTQARMPRLNSALKWELYELDERAEKLESLDVSGSGNLHAQLFYAFNPRTALERFRPAVDRLLELLRRDEITFGAGANETLLTPETEDLFRELAGRLFEHRHPEGGARNPLLRLRPERWLESVLRRDIVEIEPAILG